MITYAPSFQFKQHLRDFDDYLAIKWMESTETLEIWSTLPDRRPVMEFSYCRNNRAREKPLMNWDMEYIILRQLRNAKRWQFLSALEFQNEMLDKQKNFREAGEKEADEKFASFMSDPYWHKKRLQEYENNDFGTCTTSWQGSDTNPEGKENGIKNLEP